MIKKKVNIHMKVSTLGYSCGQGIKNIKRNKLFSLASIGTITACVFLIGLFYIILANFQYLVKEAEESVCVTVFFNMPVPENAGHKFRRSSDFHFLPASNHDLASHMRSAHANRHRLLFPAEAAGRPFHFV